MKQQDKQKKHVWFASCLLMAAVIAVSSWQFAEAGHRHKKRKTLPAKAEAGIQKAFPNAKIMKVEVERPKVVIYEAKLIHEGKKIEVNVTENGEILTVEREGNQSDLPEAVKNVLAKEAKGAKIKEIENKEVRASLVIQKHEEPKTIYEVEFLQDGKEIELEMSADGKVVNREVKHARKKEQRISLEDVPAAAKATILKHAGENKIHEVEMEVRKGEKIYEAEWKENGVEVEVKVSADGKLLKKKNDDDDKGNDEDDDD